MRVSSQLPFTEDQDTKPRKTLIQSKEKPTRNSNIGCDNGLNRFDEPIGIHHRLSDMHLSTCYILWDTIVFSYYCGVTAMSLDGCERIQSFRLAS